LKCERIAHERGHYPPSRPPRVGRAGVIALPCLLYAADLTVLNLAVPALSRDLWPSSTQLLWIVDIYGFVVAGWLITMGTLGDRIGRRPLLLVGAGVRGRLGSCRLRHQPRGADRDPGAAGGGRATIAPSTLSLIRNMFLDPQAAHGCGWGVDDSRPTHPKPREAPRHVPEPGERMWLAH
jgi:MFS transporter, DHA2 family, multidrug resistance protein